ncbi:hypothetical protein ACFUGD_06660 [Streptomyces sp. NPDC057217]|uniref:hypothetical protein n=1 Tax=Streptomyces sp. NPDC057217 TaxID=3346054 RepID=UPI0036410999
MLPHRVTIEPYLGDTAYGPTYGPPVPNVRAMVDESVRLVKDREGREVVSTAQVITDPHVVCPAESVVTLPTGRRAVVISSAPHTAPGLPVPESLEVMCE